GENGAGKSTLMKILSGAYRKDAGDIVVDGRPVAIDGPRDALALGIRVIYQELTLVPHLSVAENILLGALPTLGRLRPGIIDRRRAGARRSRLAAEWGMGIDRQGIVSRLPIAQRQMVEIAKALATGNVRILVMDEPTSSLTTKEVTQLFALIERLAAR